MYNLVIVESPAKAKTIEGYLGKKYKVTSSVGHIRDLAKTGPGGLGIDIEDNFKANYTYISGKKKVVNEIVKLAKNADKIYIATDPDREGEAIGWHIADELHIDLDDNNRVTFSEITKDGILEGMKNARSLDMDLVQSQETRRKIDRIIGFKLSKLLQKKIKAKSAGRVQSVALQMIVYREREIRDFIPVEYYKINALKDSLVFEWVNNSKKVDKDSAEEVFKTLTDKTLTVSEIKTKAKTQKAKLAYTTSTFQQDCVNKLNMTARSAMSTAQKLYEGIEIGGEAQGLITYMRTDSTRLEAKFIGSTKKYITDQFGEEYVGFYKISKSKNSQDAHEAIRPTNVFNTPAKVKNFLTKEQLKVYTLIWNRTVASIMSGAKLSTTTYLLKSKSDVEFKMANTVTLFDGYKRVYNDAEEEEQPEVKLNLKENDNIIVDNYEMTQHFTQPKARYSEAKLIKELEENGVGRPSTYASIIDTLKKRMYVELEQKKFKPTEDGELVVTTLDDYFSDIINVKYTSNMESDLDKIATAEMIDIDILQSFYELFTTLLDNAEENMVKIEAKETGNTCPECGKPLVMRKGRYGEFEGCSDFPTCKYITPREVDVIAKCPKCEKGNVIEKMTKRKKVFYACDQFPKCDYAKWTLEEVEKDIKPN